MPSPNPPERAADLADLILSIARKISVYEPEADDLVVRLSNVESLVMRFVDRHPGTTPSEIGAELGLHSGNTSAALRGLESKGLVRRRPDPADRRSVRVDPTPAAAENLRRIRARWMQMLDPVLPHGHDDEGVLRFLGELEEAFHPRADR